MLHIDGSERLALEPNRDVSKKFQRNNVFLPPLGW